MTRFAPPRLASSNASSPLGTSTWTIEQFIKSIAPRMIRAIVKVGSTVMTRGKEAISWWIGGGHVEARLPTISLLLSEKRHEYLVGMLIMDQQYLKTNPTL